MSEPLFMPYSRHIDWKDGSEITITGNTIEPLPGSYSWTFCISLCSDPFFGGNIPFHFRAEFSCRRKITLNSRRNGTWLEENLVDKPFPFVEAGQNATVIIRFSNNSLQVLVNKVVIAEYPAHRTQEKANFLYIHGDAFALQRVHVTPPRA